MRNAKAIMEDRQEHATTAATLYERAVNEDRDLTADEAKQFDHHAKAAKHCDRELELANLERHELVARSSRFSGSREASMYVVNSVTGRPEQVLPTNGILPENQPRFTPYNRIAKLKAFRGPDAEALAYAGGMWLRAVLAREFNRGIDKAAEDYCAKLNWQITNVGMEGTGQFGGYTVPAPLSMTIIDVREEVGVARRAVNIQPMSSDTLTFPRRDAGLTVYYPGEASAITLSDMDWGAVELLAKKRAVAHQMSQELVDDSIINMVDYIFREMAYALADREDAEFINGDSSAAYGNVSGLKQAIGAGGIHTAATGHDTWAELDLADIMAWIALLPDKYHARNPKIICSAAFFYSVLLRLAVQAGGNTLASLTGGADGRRNFLGYEFLLTPYMPTTTAAATVQAFFGAFDAGVILGERTGIRLARSDEYAFLNDVTTVKATSRYDIEIHAPGDATNPGAYVGLKTAA